MIKEGRISESKYDQGRKDTWVQNMIKEVYLGSEDDQAAKNILIRDKIKDGSIFVNFNYKNIIFITNTLKFLINIIKFHLTYY